MEEKNCLAMASRKIDVCEVWPEHQPNLHKCTSAQKERQWRWTLKRSGWSMTTPRRVDCFLAENRAGEWRLAIPNESKHTMLILWILFPWPQVFAAHISTTRWKMQDHADQGPIIKDPRIILKRDETWTVDISDMKLKRREFNWFPYHTQA